MLGITTHLQPPGRWLALDTQDLALAIDMAAYQVTSQPVREAQSRF
jgi:hypothetical protein